MYLKSKLRVILSIMVLSLSMNYIVADTMSPTTSALSPLYWSPDGTRIAITEANRVNILDASTGKTALHLEQDSPVTRIAWSPDSQQLVTGTNDRMIYLWNIETGEQLQTFKGEEGSVYALTWYPDGQRFVSIMAGSEFATINVWDASNGQMMGKYRGGHVNNLIFSPDGTSLAEVQFYMGIFFDGVTFEVVARFSDENTPSYYTYTFGWSPDSQQIVTGTVGGAAKIWAANGYNAEPLQIFPANDFYDPAAIVVPDSQITWVRSVMYTPDGSSVLSISADGLVRMWHLETGEKLAEGRIPLNSAAVWSPYGGRVAYLPAVDENDLALLPDPGRQVQVAVPLASLDLVKSIAAGCVVETDNIRSSLNTLTTDALPDFVAQIKELPADAIPPACTADLIAVVEALMES